MNQEAIEKQLISKYEKEKKFESIEQESNENKIHLTEEEIQLIVELATSKIREENSKNPPKSDVLNGYFNILEPKQEVIKQKEFSMGVRIAGIIILSLCIWYWIWFFFIVQIYEALTFTTYITIILISITCINKFESPLFNSLTCITAYGFFLISFLNFHNHLSKNPLLL